MKIRVLDGVDSLPELLEQGSPISRIQMGKIPGASESDLYYPKASENVLLGDVFDDEIKDQKYFVIPFFSCEHYPFHLSIRDPKKSKNDDLTIAIPGFPRIPQSFMEELSKMKKKAEFGDLLQQKTRSDEKVRKGFDVPFNKVINGFILKTNIENIVKEEFTKRTGYLGVDVEAYKLNIYEEGDFFVDHRDSPEENLIATVLYVVENEKTKGGSFFLDGQQINDRRDTLIIFYPEMLHAVREVFGSRITISFKVFSTGPRRVANPNISSIAQRLSKRVKQGDAILLNGGYSFFEKEVPFVPKGLDATLFSALDELGYKYELRPVVVENVVDCSSDIDTYYTVDNKDRYSRTVIFGNEANDLSYRTFLEKEKYNDGGDDETSGKILKIEVSNLSKKLNRFFGFDDEVSPRDVLYLGLGYKVGEAKLLNPFIGNQHNGFVLSNLYYNLIVILL